MATLGIPKDNVGGFFTIQGNPDVNKLPNNMVYVVHPEINHWDIKVCPATDTTCYNATQNTGD
jgi:hypothetical protein